MIPTFFSAPRFKESSWPGMVVRWADKFGSLLKTPATEHEIFEVLARPHIAEDMSPAFLNRIQKIFAAAELVKITERIRICRDPKDDKFLELAVNGRADVIVSGDKDLLVLGAFRDIPILAPAAFMHTREL